MKQINNLLILEVPKDAKDPQLTKGNGLLVFFDEPKPIGIATRYQLPPGNYEIIGVYEDVPVGTFSELSTNEAYIIADWYIGIEDSQTLLIIKKLPQ